MQLSRFLLSLAPALAAAPAPATCALGEHAQDRAASEVWREARTASVGLVEREGWVFSAAEEALPEGAGTLLEDSCRLEATLTALGALATRRLPADDVAARVAPALLPDALRVLRRAAGEARLTGVQEIEAERGGAAWRIVLAAPAAAVPERPLEELVAELRVGLLRGEPWADPAVTFELAPDEAVWSALARRLGDGFGAGVSESLLGLPLRSFGPGWTLLPATLPAPFLSAASTDDLWQLLAVRPHDPALLGVLAERLGKRGLTRTAARLDALARRDEELRLPEPFGRERRKAEAALPAVQRLLCAPRPDLRAVLACGGTLPLAAGPGAPTRTAVPTPDERIALLLARSWPAGDADRLLQLSEALLALGAPAHAYPFALQSQRMRPSDESREVALRALGALGQQDLVIQLSMRWPKPPLAGPERR
ncbi:MAG: hypothetical protein AAF682_14915 [Planctomycetota bacterium]